MGDAPIDLAPIRGTDDTLNTLVLIRCRHPLALDMIPSNFFEVEIQLLQDIGVTGQAFQYDPRAQLAPASQPAAAVTRPLHSINL